MKNNHLVTAGKSALVTKEARRNFRNGLLCFNASVLFIALSTVGTAQTIMQDANSKFGVSGYIRSGIGKSEGGKTQANFQSPGALNKYSLGNQADTYGELEFDYTRYLNESKDQSLDVVWMSSFYEAFGSKNKMEFNKTAQLYVRANNLLGKGEILWAGKRYYDRKAIHMLDKQWINPSQNGWGLGVERLIKKGTKEDLKIAAWTFNEDNVVSYQNVLDTSRLRSYTADARWVNIPITGTSKLNLAVNYSIRAKNEKLAYDQKDGFGAFAWLDYEKKYITNTTAILFRQGANVPINHWTGVPEKENPNNNSTVLNNLNTAYTLEVNNNFLYDDLDKFAFNGILSAVIRDFGTLPYNYNPDAPNNKEYLEGKGRTLYWLTAGARGMYYLNNYFKLHLEVTHEHIINKQLDLTGNLDKITFTPEVSLKKGFYSRPVLRPFVTYAFWSDALKGTVGTGPTGAPFGNKTAGLTYGLQFEIWW